MAQGAKVRGALCAFPALAGRVMLCSDSHCLRKGKIHSVLNSFQTLAVVLDVEPKGGGRPPIHAITTVS